MCQSVYDVVGVGFGPSNIALAVAMHDGNANLNSVFIEAQPERAWQHGMLLRGSDIQHNALRDFSTPVNPRGYFTFNNYLHETGKFFEYLNLGLGYAYRTEFAAYIDWVKSHFSDRLIGAAVAEIMPADTDEPLWRVRTEDGEDRFARAVVVGTGRALNIPDVPGLQASSRVVHATRYLDSIARADVGQSVAIVGASQSAAEITLDLLERGFADVHLIHRSFSLQLKDTSPFTDEVYFPEFVDYFYSLPDEAREALSDELRRSNYSSVDKDVLDALYRLRHQLQLEGRDPLRIHRNHEVVEFQDLARGSELTLRERYSGVQTTIRAGLTILATGFLDIGRGGLDAAPTVLRPFLEASGWAGDPLDVSRSYQAAFRSGQAHPPLFLNGLCEASHGLGDAGSFSLVSIRAREILEGLEAALGKDAARCAARSQSVGRA